VGGLHWVDCWDVMTREEGSELKSLSVFEDGVYFIISRLSLRAALCFHYVDFTMYSVVNCADDTVSAPRVMVNRPCRTLFILEARGVIDRA
jgi:hypothetical protein